MEPRKAPQGHADINLSHCAHDTHGGRGDHSTSIQAAHSPPHRASSGSRSRYDPERAANCSAAPASVGPCPPDAISTSPANAGRAGAVSMQGIIKAAVHAALACSMRASDNRRAHSTQSARAHAHLPTLHRLGCQRYESLCQAEQLYQKLKAAAK